MPRALAASAVALVAVAGVAGCSSTSNGTPDSSGSGVRAAASDPAGKPTAADLKRQLLTLADLPAGWKVDNSKDSGNDSSDEPSCMKSLDSVPDPKPEAGITFVQGAGFPLIGETLVYGGDAGEHYMSFARNAFDGCRNVSLKSNGEMMRGTIAAIAFPKLGADDLRAWRMSFTVQGIPFDFDVVLARKGAELLMGGYADLGSPDVGELESVTGKAIAKMP